jgi:hypothetical protein
MLHVGQAAQSRRLSPKVQAQPLTQQAIVSDKLSQGVQVVLHANKDVSPNEWMHVVLAQ